MGLEVHGAEVGGRRELTGRLIRLEVWDSRKKNWVLMDFGNVRVGSGEIMIGFKDFRLLVNGKEEYCTMKVKA